MLLFLTQSSDLHALLVDEKLRRRGVVPIWFDHAEFPARASISVTTTPGGGPHAMLRTERGTLDLREVSRVWLRRPSSVEPHPNVVDPVARELIKQESADFLGDLWNCLDCAWLPAPPRDVFRAQMKGYQLGLAASLGLEVPPTLVSNEPRAVLDFYQTHRGRVVCKLFSDGLYRGTKEYNRYTQVVSTRDMGYVDSSRYCPQILQAYVEKRLELRVTVVGERVLAAEIDSQSTNHTRDDWRRYDFTHTPHRPHALPDDVARRCVALVERLGLCYGAIDLVLTPDGRYVFLEINPNGQGLWIEQMTGLPISDAICDLLTEEATR
jgi:hypothetical protein